jgi:hypothetical protein
MRHNILSSSQNIIPAEATKAAGEATYELGRNELDTSSSSMILGFKGRWQFAHLGKVCRRPSRQHVQHRRPERVQVALRHRLSPELLGGHVPVSAHHSTAQERRRRLVLHCPEIDHLPKGEKREGCCWGRERCTHECPQQGHLRKRPLRDFSGESKRRLILGGVPERAFFESSLVSQKLLRCKPKLCLDLAPQKSLKRLDGRQTSATMHCALSLGKQEREPAQQRKINPLLSSAPSRINGQPG